MFPESHNKREHTRKLVKVSSFNSVETAITSGQNILFLLFGIYPPMWRHKSSPLVGATVSKRKEVFYERYCSNFRKSKPNIGRSGGVFQYWDGKDQRVVQHRGLSVCPLGWKQAHDKAQENGGVSQWCVLNLKLNSCPWYGMITIPYRALFGKELLCQRSARIIKGVF